MGFQSDIRPLFRPRDREEMDFAFDLWDVAAVRANAESILARLEDGSMPCDRSWPDEQIDLFRGWIAGGMPE